MARILVISHTPTHPVNSGNRARVNSLLRTLQDAGHEICFFFLDFGNGDNASMRGQWDSFWNSPYRFPLPSIARRMREFMSRTLKMDLYKPYQLDAWYRSRLDDELKALKDRDSFDVVLVEYLFFSKAFLSFPETVKILDTHDIFGDRHKMFLQHGQQPSWFYTTPEDEATGLKRADAILAIQEKENAYFSDLAPDTRVLTVGHITRVVPPCPTKGFANRLLFIGSGNTVNIDALNYFLDEIWPRVLNREPQSRLHIVGKICHDFVTLPEGCHALGEVADLSAVYAAADIVINPVRFGTGLKIKNIESLGYGMPLVTTLAGAEGLEPGMGKAFLVAQDAAEFVEHLCTLLSDGAARAMLATNALEYAQSYNDRAIEPLLDYLNRSLAARPAADQSQGLQQEETTDGS